MNYLYKQIYNIDNKVTPEQIENYHNSIVKHINYVQQAGLKLGVSLKQLKKHDKSKFLFEEFIGYFLYFNISKSKYSLIFADAWKHHIQYNPHHWEYWIKNGNIYEMPEIYALEMIADWEGSEMTYSNRWDMTEWLNDNIHKVNIHPNTALFLENILEELGYVHKFTLR